MHTYPATFVQMRKAFLMENSGFSIEGRLDFATDLKIVRILSCTSQYGGPQGPNPELSTRLTDCNPCTLQGPCGEPVSCSPPVLALGKQLTREREAMASVESGANAPFWGVLKKG